MIGDKMERNLRIVGIGGLPRSGKDTLAEIFMQSGYFGVSLGDIVRDQSRLRHSEEPDPISVANMTETSNYLRQSKGADFALEEALERYRRAQAEKDYVGLVVFSVRAPVEADFILEHGGELIWVEAQDEVRHHRAMNNLRPGEPEVSLEQFKSQESLQWRPQPGVPEEAQMNVSYIKSKATRTVLNEEDSLELFNSKAKGLLSELGGSNE